jgi:ribonuclease D
MSLPPILTRDEEIAALAETLSAEDVIAVDLEADSMHNYHEKICLLQFSTPAETVLVDPLEGADLSPLGEVLADPAIRKIFHAADYDIRCLRRDFGWQINGLFDTMVSCQFLGEEKFGLADVLLKYYGVELDKQFQRADWSQRPLNEGMIRYAAADTAHLHRLSGELEQRLVDAGRREWLAEEFSLLEQVRFQEHEGPLFLRAKGAGTLDRRQLAVLEALLQWRDKEAQRRDRPHFKVLGNKSLLAMATNMPRDLKGLVALEGFSPRLADRYGKPLLKEIDKAMGVPDEDLPVYPRGERRRKDARAEKRIKRLKAWRTKAAEGYSLEPGVLINNAQLEALAHNPSERVEELPGLKAWQRKEFGETLFKVLTEA